ncbi:hypothetical protein [Paenibacillus naphthalenovorans]|uniref:hypothetical protein n=1 Tax=Paenibacillus naphthalenovorans TaxID=162209 RepID=UPI000890EE94|nr:hypothetical protein [Paenibacillus naphthalenovorans]SDI49132.1 hypothetical protein SAMN05421868_10722 [Paenibacillus naphthalenovorans]
MTANKVYGPLTLPSGKVITFRKPKGLDRANVLDIVPISDENVVGGTLHVEQALKAKCVVSVDGQPVDATSFLNLFNDWDDDDVQFYATVHTEMFGMTEEKRDKAKEAARFLLGNSTSTDGSSSKAE